MVRSWILILLVGGIFPVVAQSKSLSRAQYIEKYKPLAIRNMREHRIPASITLAQACLESNNGNSALAQRSNNHFGIKCHSTWKGKRTYHDDDKRKECFRVYDDVYDSYSDHSDFLQRSRYARCFELEITDYKGWARELKKAGYATNPKYPDLLIRIIEENKLYLIDQEALGQISEKPAPKEPKRPKKPAQGGNATGGSAEIDIYNNVRIQRSANQIKYVEAESGDSPEQIAQRLNMGAWQIRKYNNVSKEHRFQPGDMVYLQPKRGKAADAEYHTVEQGETAWDISQRYGIRIKALYRKNRMKKGTALTPGQKLWLRKKKPRE